MSNSNEPLTAERVIEIMGLEPLPEEGGYYRETFRSPRRLAGSALGEDYSGGRDALTAIYFLVTAESHSAWHILPSDEVFLWHAGAPVSMLRLPAEGAADPVLLGAELTAGQRPQAVVPGHVWQACRLADPSAEPAWALLSCLVAPGFDFADFHVATPEEVESLADRFPAEAEEVRLLAPARS